MVEIGAVVLYPDRRLTQAAQPVTTFDAGLRGVVAGLIGMLTTAPALGLTAPHVGIDLRVTVIRLQPDDPPLVLVNPRIDWASAETATHTEGSVSLPGVTEEVTRPARVRVAYQDVTGAPRSLEAGGFLAACIQHEVDQLDGVFWTSRLSRLKRERLMKKVEKSRRG